MYKITPVPLFFFHFFLYVFNNSTKPTFPLVYCLIRVETTMQEGNLREIDDHTWFGPLSVKAKKVEYSSVEQQHLLFQTEKTHIYMWR